MTRIIGVCGIVCDDCPALRATREDDDELRAKTAAEWSSMFNSDIKSDDINCDGCVPDEGRKFHHCTECEIRACGLAKGLDNCAGCTEYACEQLEKFSVELHPI
jgi:hypothetical protein